SRCGDEPGRNPARNPSPPPKASLIPAWGEAPGKGRTITNWERQRRGIIGRRQRGDGTEGCARSSLTLGRYAYPLERLATGADSHGFPTGRAGHEQLAIDLVLVNHD